MSEKTTNTLKTAVAGYLDGDDSACLTLIEQEDGPDMALIRADVLEALKQKAAQFDALSCGDDTQQEDAATLLRGD